MTPFWDAARHQDRRPFLLARARIVRAVRAWFHAKGFLEVEPAMLVVSPGAETHVAAFEADGRYLHTSPEFAMKKLLAAGEDKIFFLGKAWRRGEAGPLHAEEFTMLEWYRAGAPYDEIMADCIELMRVACDAVGSKVLRWRDEECDPFQPPEKLTVAEVFWSKFQIPVLDCPRSAFAKAGVRIAADDDWGDLFSRVLVDYIEPDLGVGRSTLFYEYPAREAALARLCPHDQKAAERFELYACGVELANGFGELTDPAEQRKRLEAAMAEKQKRYGTSWPLDEDFLATLAQMPPASGVAMGLDRLIMLASGAPSIQHVLWTPD
jgi:lysyl-tRNA synthetase class 2